ncbi:hypothetical protein [Streptomyces luteolus]|uniref:Lipoprotein n=1 Tax=Streptomyces luteolus TaxID=3043615 RepID=A0ABT6STF8_9ACTN|nr:hypothetical protein [Streptomyces sp. B-S-A12]MDI3418655.1 hypothetical protein [Streptomyces sp. B-S-A12]
MRTNTTARAIAAAAVLTLALTACNNDEDPMGAPTTPSNESSESTTGEGTTGGAGGAGDAGAAEDEGLAQAMDPSESAEATFEDDGESTKLEIKPEKTVKGSWDDFKGFDLKGVETEGMVPYYVTMSFTSKGGAEPWIPTWGNEDDALVGPNQPAQGINMLDDFAKCPGVDPDVPSGKFKKGTTDRPCDIFVAPEGKPLYVRWGGDIEGQKPLVWKVAG